MFFFVINMFCAFTWHMCCGHVIFVGMCCMHGGDWDVLHWGACIVFFFDVICAQGVLHSVLFVVVQGNTMFFF